MTEVTTDVREGSTSDARVDVAASDGGPTSTGDKVVGACRNTCGGLVMLEWVPAMGANVSSRTARNLRARSHCGELERRQLRTPAPGSELRHQLGDRGVRPLDVNRCWVDVASCYAVTSREPAAHYLMSG